MRPKSPPIGRISVMHEYYRQGYTLAETARHFRVSKSSLWRWFRYLEFPVRSISHSAILKRDTAQIRAMLAEYRNGARVMDIAHRYHYYPASIYRLFRKVGIPKRTAKSREGEAA